MERILSTLGKESLGISFLIHVFMHFLTSSFLLHSNIYHIKIYHFNYSWVQFKDINKFLLLYHLFHCSSTELITPNFISYHETVTLNSLVNIIPLSVSMNLTILSTFINKSIFLPWHVASFRRIIFSRFMRVGCSMWQINSFLFKAGHSCIVCMYLILFNHLSLKGHLGCFCFLVVVSNAGMILSNSLPSTLGSIHLDRNCSL